MIVKQIDQLQLNAWVDSLIQQQYVFGVQAKEGRFAFGPLAKAEDLRLDYDVTILSPKKYFQPLMETIVRFTKGKSSYESVVDEEPFILLGVHPYDVVGISQMDLIFSNDNPDIHYLARRQNATIIASDIQTASSNIFASCMGTATVQEGFDILLTKVGDTYVVDARTEKGEALMGALQDAPDADKATLSRREQFWEDAKKLFIKHKLNCRPEELPELLTHSYEHPAWDEKAKQCFSCGSCTMVCPTCYCFNVEDEIAWDLDNGERIRKWDSCQLHNFAEVAGGHNFRKHLEERFRHRYYRKGKYLWDRMKQIACVGCGRCITACPAKIANPVELYNTLLEEQMMAVQEMSQQSIYVPEPATLVRAEQMTELERYFEIRLDSGKPLGHQPGQFVKISVPGIGEAPISISSSPDLAGTFELVVRKVGRVTDAMHNMKAGDKVGVRGPFGTGFQVNDDLLGKDVLFVCGGIGLVPVRSAIQYVLNHRKDYGKVTILYGSKTPTDRLFIPELEAWAAREDVSYLETVDRGDANWKGHVGVITTLLPKVELDPSNSRVIVCGPPIMYKFVIMGLGALSIPDDHIYVSLERRMKCGVGKCGHCQINGLYTCLDGPVFKYAAVKDAPEAI